MGREQAPRLHQPFGNIRVRVVALAAACLASAGCAGTIETRTTVAAANGNDAVQSGSYQPDSVEVAGVVTHSAQLRTRLLGVIEPLLAATGWRDGGDDARHSLSLALSSRPADLAFKADDDVAAPARRRKAFQSCAGQEHRLVLALVDRVDGSVDRRITVAETHCKASLDEVADLLATTAASAAARPAGDYSSRRRGKD